MGGIGPVSHCLASEHASVRSLAAETLATALQNNPLVQSMVGAANLLPTFLAMVDGDPDDVVRAKALLALSAYVRDNESGGEAFLRRDGLAVLGRCVTSGVPRLCRRAVFFLRHLLSCSSPVATPTKCALMLVSHGSSLLAAIAAFVAGDDSVLREDSLAVFAEFLGEADVRVAAAASDCASGSSSGAGGASSDGPAFRTHAGGTAPVGSVASALISPPVAASAAEAVLASEPCVAPAASPSSPTPIAAALPDAALTLALLPEVLPSYVPLTAPSRADRAALLSAPPISLRTVRRVMVFSCRCRCCHCR